MSSSHTPEPAELGARPVAAECGVRPPVHGVVDGVPADDVADRIERAVVAADVQIAGGRAAATPVVRGWRGVEGTAAAVAARAPAPTAPRAPEPPSLPKSCMAAPLPPRLSWIPAFAGMTAVRRPAFANRPRSALHDSGGGFPDRGGLGMARSSAARAMAASRRFWRPARSLPIHRSARARPRRARVRARHVRDRRPPRDPSAPSPTPTAAVSNASGPGADRRGIERRPARRRAARQFSCISSRL